MRTLLALALTLAATPALAQNNIIALTRAAWVDDYHTLEPTIFLEVEGVPGTRIERTLPAEPLCNASNHNGVCSVTFDPPEIDELAAELEKEGESNLRWGYGSHSRQVWESAFIIPGVIRSVEDFAGEDIGRIRWQVYAASHVEGYSSMSSSWHIIEAPEPAALALCLPALACLGRRRRR